MPWTPVYRASNKLLQALAASALVALALSAAPADASPVIHKEIRQAPAEVESSWTKADFLNAIPAGPVATPPASLGAPPVRDAAISADQGPFFPADVAALPQSLHGKVFFRMGSDEFECSGTLVESKNASSIFTAGHCVYDPETRQWASELVFVPGYENGAEPHGRYAAISLDTTRGWFDNSPAGILPILGGEPDFSEDIGVATLAGTPAADLGGAEKIAFDLGPTGRAFTIYGYPGDPNPPYDGERLVACRSTVTVRDEGTPAPLGASPCDMSHGSSGGGWMTGGYLNSVVSYVYCEVTPDFCGYVFGPYFSSAAKALYMGEGVGGSVAPTVKVKYSPPRLVTKRKVLFKFDGEGSTPIGFLCRFDRRAFVRCGARTTITRLTAGRHTLKVRSIDQTGQKSQRLITRKFRVSLKR